MSELIGISGEFFQSEKRSKERCKTHPYCAPGSCGFYLGHEHEWTPTPTTPLPTPLDKKDKEDIVDWTLAHQATNHRIVAMNERQYRNFKRRDKIGIIELPSYIREETPVQAALRSHEIPPIIA